ncbi:MAG: hypothetical protein ACI9VR_003745 [Cognaticolwellia sp.]|jgi:hypothetical protein
MKRLIALPLLAAAALFSVPASAACEKEVAAAQKKEGAAVAPAFKKVIECDAKIAKQTFPTLLQKTADVDSIVALSMVAIENDVWNPVWEMLSLIKDYDARDEVAEAIGGKCAENEKVVSFLQGAYFGLRDIEFSRWEGALVTCQAETFDAWLVSTVESPPAKQYDEKYSKVAEIYVKRTGVASLDSLSKAGVKAAETNGPFDAVLIAMDSAVAPELGADISPDDQAALETSLVAMAQSLPPEQAKSIADRLSNAGSSSAAASLLPAIYPDRMRGGNSFVYGGIAIESGECKGGKTAILHVAEVHEPGKRYIIAEDANAGMSSFGPKLKKCDTDTETWPVIISAEPLGADDLDDFFATIESQWTEKGYEVKRRDEDKVVLD